MSYGGGLRSAGARHLLASSCLIALATVAQPALAQNNAEPQEAQQSQNSDGIQDIVVTARFVAENIQDTPIAITAATQETLQSANVSNIGELGRVIPNLRTIPGDSQSAGTPVIRLRGVLQGGSSSLATPPALGIYTDDIYHGTTAGSELDFTDIERLEVNRGPQSTLSGNASIGGSIKLYTVDPKGDGSGYIEFIGGSRKHMEAAGALDIGLSDTLAIRASGHFKRQDGYGNRLDFSCMMDKLGTPQLKGGAAPGAPNAQPIPYFQPDSRNRDCVLGHTGGGQMAVGQIKLRWQPTDGIDLILTARHREEDLEETPEVTLGFQPACAIGIAGATTCPLTAGAQTVYRTIYQNFGLLPDNRFLPPERNGGIYDTYATNCRPFLNLTGIPMDSTVQPPAGSSALAYNWPVGFCYEPRKTAHNTLLSGKLVADLSDKIQMTAIAGYTNYSNEFTQNGDQTPLGIVVTHFLNRDTQWSGELRFNGKLFDDKLQWIVGGFAVKIDGSQLNNVSFSNVFQLADIYAELKSQSLFFHLDYNITDAWRVSGGARWSNTENSFTIRNPQTGYPTLTELGAAKEKRWDWLLSTDYKVTDDILVYASAATGSRPPGFVTIATERRQYQQTGAEELLSYEAGVKADFFDRRLRLNLAGFYSDYKKIAASRQGTQCLGEPVPNITWYPFQQATAEATNNCLSLYGSSTHITYFLPITYPATIRGFELELTARPVHGLNFEYSLGGNKFKSKITTPGQPGYLYEPANRWQWNQYAQVSYDIETGVGTFTPNLSWTWYSWQHFDPAVNTARPVGAPISTPVGRLPEDIFVIPAYSLFNGGVSYESPDRSWSARLSVVNLADKWYHYQVLRGTVNAQTRVAEPRTWSISIKKTF